MKAIIEEWSDGCGCNFRYGDNVFGFDADTTRDLFRSLSELMMRWGGVVQDEKKVKLLILPNDAADTWKDDQDIQASMTLADVVICGDRVLKTRKETDEDEV